MLNFNILIFISLLSFGLSVFCCLGIKRIFNKLKIVDIPNERSSHDVPTILSGGIAFLSVFGFLVCLLKPNLVIENVFVIVALVILFFVSFYDDLKNVSNKLRFFVHFLVGNAFYFSNIRLLSVDFPFFEISFNNYMSYFCTILFVMAMINIYNFMDGIDGYAGGVGFIAALFFSFSFLFMKYTSLSFVCFVLVGVLLGFLFFNFPMPKAQMFMGDVGSAVLGALFALFSLKYSMHSYDLMYSIIIPMMVLGVFICDASFTFFIRMIKKENIFEAHCSHFYQKLIKVSWNHCHIVLLEYMHMVINIVFVCFFMVFEYKWIVLLLFFLLFFLKFSLIQYSYNKKHNM